LYFSEVSTNFYKILIFESISGIIFFLISNHILSHLQSYSNNLIRNFELWIIFWILTNSARYSAIFWLLQSYSFCSCFATSCESPLMRSHRMLRSLASRSPVTSPSYSAMLFVAGNSSWIVYFRIPSLEGWARHQPLVLWECRIHWSTSPSDQATHQLHTVLNQSTRQWNLWVLDTWSPIGGQIQHHIG
jgi:hypothetical protein